MLYTIKNIFKGIFYGFISSLSCVLISTISINFTNENYNFNLLIKRRIVLPAIFGAFLGFGYGIRNLINIESY